MAIVFLLAGPLLSLHAEVAVPHYLFLIDTSYSMGLRMPLRSETQWQLAVKKLSEYLLDADGRYALAEFSDSDTFRVIIPFTSSKHRLQAALEKPPFWEATDVRDAVEEAVRYVKSAELADSSPVSIVVATDAIDTRSTLYSLPPIKAAGRSDEGAKSAVISIEYLTVGLPYNSPAERRVKYWTAAERGQRSRPRSKSIEFRAESTLRYSPFGKGKWRLLFMLLSALVLLPLIAVALCYCRAVGKKTNSSSTRKNRRLGPDSGVVEQPRYSVHFIEYQRQKDKRECRIEFRRDEYEIPVSIGANGFVRTERENCQALITFEEEGWFLTSDTPLLINGVAVRRRKIRPGITIAFGASRFKLQGIERAAAEDETAEPEKLGVLSPREARLAGAACFKRRLLLWAAGSLLIVGIYAAVLIFATDGALPSKKKYESTAHLRFTPYEWEHEFIYPEANPGRTTSAERSAGVNYVRGEALKTIQGSWDGREWRFDGIEDKQPVDYLFFHAHPDDEALDYGGLLARLQQEGQRAAVVLFTDGEAGLSRGPERASGSAPAVLKSIRVQEASDSLRILGADLYIRLGLRNHPYSSQQQVLPIEQVYAAWGGLESVEAAVYMLIEQLRPRVIVSPDGPTAAREHFEHEAVGQAVMQVLQEMELAKSDRLPQRYLRLVDPMQQGVYSRFTGIDVLRPLWPYTESPRSVQNRALKAHQSQIDARIVGLEYSPLFDSEYYQVREYNE